MNNEIIKFVNGDLELDVNISPNKNTVWLTVDQLYTLFNKNKSTISRHIKNIFMKANQMNLAQLQKMQLN